MIAISLKPLNHRSQECIGIYYDNHSSLNGIVRKIAGAKWSQENKCWYVPLSKENYNKLYFALKEKAELDITALKQYLEKRKQVAATALPPVEKKSVSKPISPASPVWKLSQENLGELEKYIQHLILKAYSPSTISTYRNEFLQLLQLLKKKRVNELTTEDLKRYFVYCFEKLQLTENTLHSRINAIYPVGFKKTKSGIIMFTFY
jgi:hypothetical protein